MQQIVGRLPARSLRADHVGEVAAALAIAAGTLLGLYQRGNRVSLTSVIESYANLYVQKALNTALARKVTLRRLARGACAARAK